MVDEPAQRERMLAALREMLGTDRDDIAGTFMAMGLAMTLAWPCARAMLVADVVPSLRGARMRLDGGPKPAELALTGQGWPLADLTFDAAQLFAEVEAMLADPLAALARRTRRPERALWRSAGDCVVEALVAAGVDRRPGDDESAACRRLAKVTAALPARLHVPVRISSVAGSPLHLRAGCCLVYRADGRPSKCVGCPLVRTNREREELAGQARAARS